MFIFRSSNVFFSFLTTDFYNKNLFQLCSIAIILVQYLCLQSSMQTSFNLIHEAICYDGFTIEAVPVQNLLALLCCVFTKDTLPQHVVVAVAAPLRISWSSHLLTPQRTQCRFPLLYYLCCF